MSNYYIPKRKKIRGWKRRIKQIDTWGEWIQEPDLGYYEHRDFTYERCILRPFYMREKRHPPLWFYKLIISKFVGAYYNWNSVFKERGKPYDLILWLYDPAYVRSQVVCYKVDKEGERSHFSWESELSKPFPFKKFESKACNLDAFDWILADEENIHFESELEDEDFIVEDLFRDGWVKKVHSSGEVYYAQRIGDIWMGRLKY